LRPRAAPERVFSGHFALVSFCFALAGCSVGMAMSGKKDPNLGAFRIGSTRGEVELQLGSPISTTTTAEGRRVDLYEYEIGNEPSAGRAIAHGVMDVLTLGIWEIIGTPIRGLSGNEASLHNHLRQRGPGTSHQSGRGPAAAQTREQRTEAEAVTDRSGHWEDAAPYHVPWLR